MATTLHAEMVAWLDCHPGDDVRLLAADFLAETDHSLLADLLANEFARLRRDAARLVELAEIAAIHRTPPEWTPKLRANLVALGDRKTTTFGQMTVEQHRIRIAMLTKVRDGVDRTIGLHEEAVAAIEAAGVTCLDDLAAPATVSAPG
jgi:hypothetical protein